MAGTPLRPFARRSGKQDTCDTAQRTPGSTQRDDRAEKCTGCPHPHTQYMSPAAGPCPILQPWRLPVSAKWRSPGPCWPPDAAFLPGGHIPLACPRSARSALAFAAEGRKVRSEAPISLMASVATLQSQHCCSHLGRICRFPTAALGSSPDALSRETGEAGSGWATF